MDVIERESRWRSRQPMRVKGDSGPPKVAEATVIRIDDGWVYLRVTRGHGSRRGRTYGMQVDDLLSGWTRVDYAATEILAADRLREARAARS